MRPRGACVSCGEPVTSWNQRRPRCPSVPSPSCCSRASLVARRDRLSAPVDSAAWARGRWPEAGLAEGRSRSLGSVVPSVSPRENDGSESSCAHARWRVSGYRDTRGCECAGMTSGYHPPGSPETPPRFAGARGADLLEPRVGLFGCQHLLDGRIGWHGFEMRPQKTRIPGALLERRP